MREERSFEGEWWVPDDPARRVPGTMAFTADGFWLHTRGALLAPPDLADGEECIDIWEPAAIAAVFGEADDRTKVTLLELNGRRAMLPVGVDVREVWRPRVALVGSHLDDSSKFDVVTVRTEHLDEWAGTPGLATEVTFDEDDRPIACELKGARQVLDTAELAGFGRVSVESQPEGRHSHHEATLALRSRFWVYPPEPVLVNEALERAGVLRQLVRLAVGGPCAVESIRLRAATGDEHDRSTWVDVLQRTTALLRGPAKPVDSFDLLFRREDTPGGFDGGLRRWIELREMYSRAWRLLTASDDARVVDGEEQFVAASRAIEVFHAVDFGGAPSATVERDARVHRAIDALPEDLKDWARPLLEESTPPVARHRVLTIVAALGDVGRWLAGDEPELFAAYVIGTRNYLVHPTRTTVKRLLTERDDIVWFGRSLRWMSTLYLLRAFGMSDSDRDALARRNGQASAAATQVGEFLRLSGHHRQPEGRPDREPLSSSVCGMQTKFLHEAMEEVLRGQGWLSIQEVAERNAARGLWRRPSDGAFPDPGQIRRRAVQSNGRHLERFEVSGGRIRLR